MNTAARCRCTACSGRLTFLTNPLWYRAPFLAATLSWIFRSDWFASLDALMVSNVRIDVMTGEYQLQVERGVLISVIVPVHNGLQVIGRCLEALRLSTYANFEVLVVDDCSTDATPQIIKNFGVRCLKTARKMGPAGARNLGAKHCIG